LCGDSASPFVRLGVGCLRLLAHMLIAHAVHCAIALCKAGLYRDGVFAARTESRNGQLPRPVALVWRHCAVFRLRNIAHFRPPSKTVRGRQSRSYVRCILLNRTKLMNGWACLRLTDAARPSGRAGIAPPR
jgi:hypothetical protein